MSNRHPKPSYRDSFALLFAEIRSGEATQREQLSFFGIVTAYDGGPPKTASVARVGSTVSEGPYRVANHINTLAVGTRVNVQDVTGEGGFVVMAEVTL